MDKDTVVVDGSQHFFRLKFFMTLGKFFNVTSEIRETAALYIMAYVK